MVKINFKNLPNELEDAVKDLLPILDLELCQDGIPVIIEKNDIGLLKVSVKDSCATILYGEKVHLFRALSLLAQHLKESDTFEIIEKPTHDLLGPMVDCSRNAVLSVESCKKLARHLALMGHNALMLYTEDTYEISEYPYFGYMRGKYTAGEIKEIDSYCSSFGIELIPCIQTLAHLNAALRWPSFSPIVDLGDILFVDEPKTYEFIEAMLKSCADMFKSRRINLGMDEAHMLGLGKYLERFGLEKRSKIMQKHLKKVMVLCEKYNFKPMMWSDMFFRTGANGETRDYYDIVSRLPDDIHEMVPENMSLIYWDYYHNDIKYYDKLIELHQGFKNEVIFAGGAWKWTGFAPNNGVSFAFSKLALESCNTHGIKKLLITAWGDNGGECSIFSVLPVLQLFAESCYAQNTTDEHLKKRFYACTKGILKDFMDLDIPNQLQGNETPEKGVVNPSKYLLFQDILSGVMDKHVEEDIYANEYKEYAEILSEAAKRNPEWAYLFNCLASLCDVLTLKSDIGIKLKKAYDSNDKDTLKNVAENVLPKILERIVRFEDAFSNQWYIENKVYGYDVQDIRLGGLKNRIKTAIKRVNGYLDGTIDSLPELAENRLYADCRQNDNGAKSTILDNWGAIASASVL